MLLIKDFYFSACPTSIFFNLVPSVDQRETFSRQQVHNLDKCLRICYAHDFCFSIIYKPFASGPSQKTDDHQAECFLSYISAFNCSRKQFIASSGMSQQLPLTAESLRCPGLGDYGKKTLNIIFTVCFQQICVDINTTLLFDFCYGLCFYFK